MTVAGLDLHEYSTLPFPPYTSRHVLNCSYHAWYAKYRRISPKARLIPLIRPFVEYLRADGIVLPGETLDHVAWSDSDSGVFSGTEEATHASDEEPDVSMQWRVIHQAIEGAIDELDGKVAPKLNWSAPKDATWINATNSMECRSPNDVYLLLKSSDFISHDLEHAFDGCADDPPSVAEGIPAVSESASNSPSTPLPEIPYYLILRKHVLINPSVEFRCFVRNRALIGICQRDLNHFQFLFQMQDHLRNVIEEFFSKELRDTYPDENFAFDVYIPAPHRRVWLVDINLWAPRTDPLLFSWLELLTMPAPTLGPQRILSTKLNGLSVNSSSDCHTSEISSKTASDHESIKDGAEAVQLELRLIKKDDPEAYSFNTPQYSAHKLPKDVVDASLGGSVPLREFADRWKEMSAGAEERVASESSDE